MASFKEEALFDRQEQAGHCYRFRYRLLLLLLVNISSILHLWDFGPGIVVPVASTTFGKHLQNASAPMLMENDAVDELPLQEKSVAVALISMGPNAFPDRAILSIRRRGAFQGYIVVLTDDTSTHPYEHLARNDTKVIVQTVRPDHWSHTARGAMRFKRFKTYVLEYMDLDRRLDDIDLVLYMDIDILVGDSLMDFVHGFVQSPYCRNSNNTNNGTITTVPAATKQNESLRRSTKTSGRICHRAGSDDDSRLYHFTDNDNSIFPFHGGFCIMERPKSQYCLELWRKEIDEAGGTSDQYALKRLLWHFAEHNVTGCELIAMNRGETFVFPIARSLIAMKLKKEFPTFVHITATTRAKSIDATTQREFFEEILMLDKQEKTLNNSKLTQVLTLYK